MKSYTKRALEAGIYRQFRDGRLYGSPRFNTERIMQVLDAQGVFPREGETEVELIEGKTLVVRNGDDVRHALIHNTWFIEGEPRPTEPGVYQDPKNPTDIYTLYNGGEWRSNRNFLGTLGIAQVPDNLVKIA